MTTARGSEKEPTKGELSEAAIVAQNAAALRALQNMMPGLGV